MKNRTIGILFLVAFSLMITGALSKRVIWDEVISPERLLNRVSLFNKWYAEHTGNTKVEARLNTKDTEWTRVGLFAKENFNSGETYMTVDRSKVIKADLVYETKFGNLIKSMEDSYGYDDYTNMVFFLLHEMNNKDSFWKPYLDLLPRQLTSVVFKYAEKKNWVEEELLNTPTLKKIIDYKFLLNKKSSNFYYALVKNNTDVFDENFFNQENIEWACMILDSRLIYINYEAFLIPMLDFANYDSSVDVFKAQFDESYTTSEIKATHYLRSDNEIFMNIGYNNENYLLYHGMVLKENQQDCYSLSMTFSGKHDDPLKDYRRVFFASDECLSLKNPFPRRLMFYFYTQMMDEIDLEKPDPKRFGLENDKIIVDYVKNILQSVLEAYQSPLDDDKKRELNEPDTYKKNILNFQIEQKTYLMKLIHAYHQQLGVLNKEDTL